MPVLAEPLGDAARRAVPLNLAVSLVTVLVSLVTRANALPVAGMMP